MEQFELVAEKREDVGKGASRRLRRAGKLPGIVYGTKKDVTMITLPHNEVMHHLDHEAFYSHILTLTIGKDSEKVVLKDLQRHPFKRSVLHIDLQRVDENVALTMRIPLHYINEEICVGVKEGGGVVSHLMTQLDIVCLPKDLPEYIEIDMIEVELGATVHLSNLVMPEGVQIYSLLHGGDEAQPVASVHVPKVIVEEEDVVAEDEGAVAAAEGEGEGEAEEAKDGES